jgi:hypothetical protein
MKLLTVIGLCLDLVGVVILGGGEVMKGAASLRGLKEAIQILSTTMSSNDPGMSEPSSGWVPHSVLERLRRNVSCHPIELFR